MVCITSYYSKYTKKNNFTYIIKNVTGPSIDFSVRRTKIASEDLYKLARRQPKQLKVMKKKNITRDGLNNKKGRVHMTKQNIDSVQTRKVKALRRTPAEKKEKRQKKKAELRKSKESVK